MFQPDKDLSVANPIPRFHDFAAAIREGCRMYPKQCRGALFRDNDAACALGAARAAGYDEFQHDEVCSTELESYMECPVDDCGTWSNVVDTVTHLNDAHRWRRERIADWLETLE